jgi:hypothetical protein
MSPALRQRSALAEKILPRDCRRFQQLMCTY